MSAVSSIVARSVGTWKRVRVQNVCASLSLRVRATAPTLSCCRAASTLNPATTAASSSSSHNNSIDRWRSTVHTSSAGVSCRKYSSAQPTDEPNADVEIDSGSTVVVPESHLAVSKEDEKLEENKRRRLSDVLVSEVLKAKHSHRWVDPVVTKTATVKQAIVTSIEGGLSGMMVLEEDLKHVIGLITSRDLLRIMALGIKEGESNESLLSRQVGDFMTPISQVIYGRPDETVGMCRTVMAKLGIKCLPILSRAGRVEGLLTARDMSDFGLSATDKGGKKNYLNDVSERVGLSSDTSMAEPPAFLRAHLALEQSPLYVNVGISAMPHPFKTEHGVARNQRELGQSEYASDLGLSEDAFFATTVKFPDEKDQSIRDFVYLGVADGVGSWREYGVDPRDFSRKIMEECENILVEASQDGKSVDGRKFRQVIAPSTLMAKAYERVKAENIVGSSTVCVALFDSIRHQLHFSNLGDSGIIVLRHIDSDVAGSLKRDRVKPRSERVTDLRVAFVSQQQLRSFNHPFQLGWTGDEIAKSERTSFKSARESCSSSIHVRRGDIVIMATDGLFDNVDIDEIIAIALEWEQKCGFIRSGDVGARERRWSMGNSLTGISAEQIGDLSKALCERARENSLDPELDSPFAILAKENDIMWSGGMPDDCTVIAFHCVGQDANDTMDQVNK